MPLLIAHRFALTFSFACVPALTRPSRHLEKTLFVLADSPHVLFGQLYAALHTAGRAAGAGKKARTGHKRVDASSKRVVASTKRSFRLVGGGVPTSAAAFMPLLNGAHRVPQAQPLQPPLAWQPVDCDSHASLGRIMTRLRKEMQGATAAKPSKAKSQAALTAPLSMGQGHKALPRYLCVPRHNRPGGSAVLMEKPAAAAPDGRRQVKLSWRMVQVNFKGSLSLLFLCIYFFSRL